MRKDTVSSTALREQIEGLRHMTVGQLKERYREVFGEASRSGNKQFLFRRIAWRIQANAEGDLSERARKRALEIANDSDLRIRAPKNFLKEEVDESRTLETRAVPTEDPRLPMPGSELVRRYRGKDIVVRVRKDGFEYAGKIHRSLSSELLEKFERRGVALISVAESLDTGSAAGRLVLNIMTAVSQWEREAIGERTRDALSHKRSSGERVGNIRFGYRLCADGKHVEPDPGEQAVLTEIRQLRRGGHTLRGIAATLNHRALRTRRGSAWRLEHVARIIKQGVTREA